MLSWRRPTDLTQHHVFKMANGLSKESSEPNLVFAATFSKMNAGCEAGKAISILDTVRPSVHTPRETNGRTSNRPLFVRGLFADANGQNATLAMRAGRPLREVVS